MSRRKPYVRPMRGWWRRNPYFTRYMVREGTSIFLALYACVLLIGVTSLASGEASYGDWLAIVRHPVSIGAHVVVLVAAAYHAVTWFAVSPKAMPPLRIAGEAIPPHLVIAGQYAATAVASVVIVALAFGD